MEKKPGSKVVAVLVIVISIVAILVIYQLTVGSKTADPEATGATSTSSQLAAAPLGTLSRNMIPARHQRLDQLLALRRMFLGK